MTFCNENLTSFNKQYVVGNYVSYIPFILLLSSVFLHLLYISSDLLHMFVYYILMQLHLLLHLHGIMTAIFNSSLLIITPIDWLKFDSIASGIVIDKKRNYVIWIFMTFNGLIAFDKVSCRRTMDGYREIVYLYIVVSVHQIFAHISHYI